MKKDIKLNTKLTLSSSDLYLKLLAYLKPMLPIFCVAILTSVCFAALDAYTIKLLQPLVDKGVVARDQDFIKFLPVLIPCLFLFRGLFSFASNYSMAWVSRNIILRIRSDLFTHYLRLPTSFFDKHNTGELLAKIIYNADQLYKACTDIVIDVIREGFVIIFLLVVMFLTSWKLTLVFLLSAPIMGILFYLTSKIFRKLSYKAQDAIGDVMHHVREALDGQQEIRVFNGHQHITNKINSTLVKYNKREMRQVLIKSLSVPVVQLIGGIALSFTLFIALSGIVDNSLTAGGFASLFGAMIAVLKPLKQATSLNIYLQRALAAADSIFSVLALPTEQDNGQYAIAKVQGNIKFNNISFYYASRKNIVLDCLNLEVKAKQTIALVGHSGSGKSTLVKLLPRFYDHYSGEILLDDIDIKQYALDNLRSHISIVSQNVILFNESISNNIVYSDRFDNNKLIAASKAAGIYDFIKTLPDEFNTVVGENGVLMSGGQRQRIAIARAIYKNAPILILDEATSALDTKLEREIQSALEALMENRTTIIIAHRLSTIVNADKIIVMDKGRIIEQGSHQELLSNNSVYTNLYNMQFTEHVL